MAISSPYCCPFLSNSASEQNSSGDQIRLDHQAAKRKSFILVIEVIHTARTTPGGANLS
jgi:hypothetical protein